MNDVNYIACFGNISNEDKSLIINFWETEGLSNLPDFNSEERLKQIGLLAKNSTGDIIGISSYYLDRDEYLEDYFYYLRASVKKEYRKSGVAAVLVKNITDELERNYEDQAKKNTPNLGKGAVIVYENPYLKKFFNGAVVEAPTFYFYAIDNQDCPRRVHYFKNAKILT